jgi:hypothetical protein
VDPSPLFGFMRERHLVHLRRRAGLPQPWTRDPVLMRYKFCNVYRELDRTTRELRVLTDRMRDQPEVLMLVTALRWLNRVETWRTLLRVAVGDPALLVSMLQSPTQRDQLERELRSRQRAPYVTGAYIVKTPDGMDKLRGVFRCVELFSEARVPLVPGGPALGWRDAAEVMLRHRCSLRRAWTWLCGHEFQGGFTAYEVVSDLRHTDLLCRAPDIMTWAPAGPGAKRGLNRLHGRPLEAGISRDQQCAEIRELLVLSQDRRWWPAPSANWPALEMRDIEHSLCELDKHMRVVEGSGRPRSTFVPSDEPMP